MAWLCPLITFIVFHQVVEWNGCKTKSLPVCLEKAATAGLPLLFPDDSPSSSEVKYSLSTVLYPLGILFSATFLLSRLLNWSRLSFYLSSKVSKLTLTNAAQIDPTDVCPLLVLSGNYFWLYIYSCGPLNSATMLVPILPPLFCLKS